MPAPTIVGTPVATRYGDLSVTVPSGADYLLCGGGFSPGGVAPGGSGTFNGDAMTVVSTSENDEQTTAVVGFGLVNPDITTGDFVLSGTGPTNKAAMAFDGVDSGTPTGTPVTNYGTSTTPTVTITSSADAVAVCILRFQGSANTVTGGTGETIQVQQTEDANGIALITKAGAGSVSFAPTLADSTAWVLTAYGVNGVSAGGLSIPIAMHHYTKNLG